MSMKYIARSSAVAARRLGNEMIIMSAPDSKLFSLNEVGTAIWLAADGRTTLSEIVENHICAEFDIAPERAYAEAAEFVEQLARHGVLVSHDQPINPATVPDEASA
jgi:Coenzyme PQQ synthesis protein D (PqqD)